MHPVHDMASNIVYAANSGNIEMTVVDGKVLYEKGEYKTIDIEKTIFETEKSTKEILSRI